MGQPTSYELYKMFDLIAKRVAKDMAALGKPKLWPAQPAPDAQVYSSIAGRWITPHQDETDEEPVLDSNGWRK